MALLAAALACCLVPTALASGRTDPSFGVNGIAALPLPVDAGNAGAGIVDLANVPAGGSIGLLGGIPGPSFYLGLARFTPAGAIDTSFGQGGFAQPPALPGSWRDFPHAEAQGEAVAVGEAGELVVAGYLAWGLRRPEQFGPLVARYDANGFLDAGFGEGGIVPPAERKLAGGTVFHAVAIRPGGRIVAVGARNERDGLRASAGVVVAYRSDGTVDPTFRDGKQVLFQHRLHFGSYTGLTDVQVLQGGKILVAGFRNDRLVVAQLEDDGSLDRDFGGGDGIAILDIGDTCCILPASLAVAGNGKIVVAATGGNVADRVFLVRYRPNGSLDRSFGEDGVAAPRLPVRLAFAMDVAVQSDGGILAVGRSERTKADRRPPAYAVLHLLPNGKMDRSFGRDGLRTFRVGRESIATAALAQPDGGVLVGGSFLADGDDSQASSLLLTRFLPD